MVIIFNEIVRMIAALYTMLFGNKRSNKIVILSFHLLGDTVSTFSAIKLVKQKFGNDSIHLFCYDTSEPIYRIKYPDLNYITFNSGEIDLFKKKINLKFLKLHSKIKQLKPRLVFDITSSIKTSVVTIGSGSDVRVGFGNRYLRGFFTHFILFNVDQHVSNYYLSTVNNYLNENTGQIPEVFHVNYDSNDKILVNPFAGWEAKSWSLKNFLVLTKELNKKYDTALLFEEGLMPVEIENDLRRKEISFIKSSSISDLINILKECSLLISNDTGPILIAALLGKPTFPLYGPTNPIFHVPPGNNYRYVQENILCSPRSYQKMCFANGGRGDCPANECMRLLRYNDVMSEVNRFIEELKINPRLN